MNLALNWVSRVFLLFLTILIVLIVGKIFLPQYHDYDRLKASRPVLENIKQEIVIYRNEAENSLKNRVEKFGKFTLTKLNIRLKVIDQKIKQNKLIQNELGLSKNLPLGKDFVKNKKLEIEIILLEQERDYLILASSLALGNGQLERLRKIHVAAYARLKNYDKQNPFEAIFKSNNHKKLYAENHKAYLEYQAELKSLRSIKASKWSIDIKKSQIDSTLEALYKTIEDQRKLHENNLFKNIFEKIDSVFWDAFKILIGCILIPVVIKYFFYYLLAPLASRRPPICILPEVSGVIRRVCEDSEDLLYPKKMSDVSLQITIKEDQELLINPEYLQSSSSDGKKDTKWLLSYSLPLSSLISGMVALTRIRTDNTEMVVVSSQNDPLSELGVIGLPEGSAVVLQPRSLVGVMHSKDLPIKITRHWRIFSLHAWLTLQLRYLVFHGPAEFIIKGCRGIRIERAGIGRRISQAATIGFSANLQYSTTRSETFFPYLISKQELFNDGFTGDSGFYVYEEMPQLGRKSGIAGRGLDGAIDALLKVFGI